MRVIGLLGGMGPPSTELYYRQLCAKTNAKLGAAHSARVVIWADDFETLSAHQRSGEWARAGDMLAGNARRLVQAGAEVVALTANTMHIVADQIQAAIDVPLLRVTDAVTQRLQEANVKRVLLLGTSYTMEQPFYREALAKAGFLVSTPEAEARKEMQRVIYDELTKNIVRKESAAWLRQLIARSEAEAALLACTELGMLVTQNDVSTRLFDTVELHTDALLAAAL